MDIWYIVVFIVLTFLNILKVEAASSVDHTSTRLNNRLFHFPPSLFFRRTVSTETLTSLTVVTETDTTSVVCAKLINVTGPCLRRRGAWVQEPIVLSFNDDMDDAVDLLYSPVLKQDEKLEQHNINILTQTVYILTGLNPLQHQSQVNWLNQEIKIPQRLFLHQLKVMMKNTSVKMHQLFSSNSVVGSTTHFLILPKSQKR